MFCQLLIPQYRLFLQSLEVKILTIQHRPTGLCPVTRSFTTRVVTGALEYLLINMSCPTHNTTMMFMSVPSRLQISAWAIGLQAGSKVPGRILSASLSAPTRVYQCCRPYNRR